MTDLALGALCGGGGELTIDLDRLVGSHACAVANSGGGKSGLIRRLLEVTHGRIQHLVLDVEDEFYTLRQSFDYVIAGGAGGDAPAPLQSAGALAKASLQHGFSLIAQLNDLGDEGAPEFVADFLIELMSAPREQWRPLLVVVDEAQRFAPRAGESAATAAIKDLLARGRKRGFTAVLASQSLPDIDPRVRGMVHNWMLGGVSTALDRKTVADALGFPPSSAEARDLQGMPPRTFWGYGPALSRVPVQFRVTDVVTTPVQPGQAQVVTPPPAAALAEILKELAVAPPAELAPLAQGKADQPASAEAEAATEAKGFERGLVEGEARGERRGIAIGISRARTAIDELRVDDLPAPTAPEAAPPPAPTRLERQRRTAPATVVQPNRGELSASARKLLEVLRAPNLPDFARRWSDLAILAVLAPSGGSFNAARKQLLDSGLVIDTAKGLQAIAADPLPSAAASDMGGAPIDVVSVIEAWCTKLGGSARRILSSLYVTPGTKVELARELELAPKGGSWNAAWKALRSNGLVEERDGGRWAVTSVISALKPERG